VNDEPIAPLPAALSRPNEREPAALGRVQVEAEDVFGEVDRIAALVEAEL